MGTVQNLGSRWPARNQRDRETARVQGRIAEREVAARVRQAAADSRRAARVQARAGRAARPAAMAAWAAGHVAETFPLIPLLALVNHAGFITDNSRRADTPGTARGTHGCAASPQMPSSLASTRRSQGRRCC